MHLVAPGESNTVPTASCVVQKAFLWVLQNTPLQVNWCEGLSCNGRRIGQDVPNRLKRGTIDLWRVFCKKHLRLLESENYFQYCGVPKLIPNDLSLTSGQTAMDDPKYLEYSTICCSWLVIKSVLWFVRNGWLVAEIWPFWGSGECVVQKISLLVVYISCGKLRVNLMEKGSMWTGKRVHVNWRKVPCELEKGSMWTEVNFV